MKQLRTVCFAIVASILLLPGVPSVVGAAPSGGHGPSIMGDPLMRPITVKGRVVCTNCDLDDIRPEHSGSNLYQFTNERGSLVLNLTWVNDRHLWRTIVWPRQLRIRTSMSVFEQLTSEENIRAEVQLSGFLRNTRTFDIGQLVLSSVVPSQKFAANSNGRRHVLSIDQGLSALRNTCALAAHDCRQLFDDITRETPGWHRPLLSQVVTSGAYRDDESAPVVEKSTL
ncbi:MAG: hypothetical protein FJ147_21800 [Deltaproteobacteria bacterium]|nr:hypothetical protein [Deltaproteobacteria bacterium]